MDFLSHYFERFIVSSNLAYLVPLFFTAWLCYKGVREYFTLWLLLSIFIFSSGYHYLAEFNPEHCLAPLFKFVDWSLAYGGGGYVLYRVLFTSIPYRGWFSGAVFGSGGFFYYGYLGNDYHALHPWFHLLVAGIVLWILVLIYLGHIEKKNAHNL